MRALALAMLVSCHSGPVAFQRDKTTRRCYHGVTGTTDTFGATEAWCRYDDGQLTCWPTQAECHGCVRYTDGTFPATLQKQ